MLISREEEVVHPCVSVNAKSGDPVQNRAEDGVPRTAAEVADLLARSARATRKVGVELEMDDFDRISANTPLLADLKPGGQYVATDVYEAGGWQLVANRLVEAGILHTDSITVTGKTIGEEASAARETAGQKVVRPLSDPISPNGGLAILRGNLAPEGCVVKIAGNSMTYHRGPARVFDSEESAFEAVQSGNVKKGDVVIIR